MKMKLNVFQPSFGKQMLTSIVVDLSVSEFLTKVLRENLLRSSTSGKVEMYCQERSALQEYKATIQRGCLRIEVEVLCRCHYC
jgi:hypothetical protein